MAEQPILPPDVLTRLWSQGMAQIDALIQRFNKLEANMSAAMDKLAAAVKENTDVVASATLAFQDLAVKIKDAAMAEDLTLVSKLADDLHANSAKLGEAVAANTAKPAEAAPVEPAPAPAEPQPEKPADN